MQFLLTAVNARYIHSNPALYSLRAYAGEALKPYIALAEYTINNRMEEILGDLYKRKPDVIGFSCYIWNIGMIRELVRELPKVLPKTDIWLGGPEVSFESGKLLLELPMVKGIMAGEGEETFKELLSFYACRSGEGILCRYQRMEDIPGLVLRQGKTAERELLEMDRLPFPYDELKDLKNRIIYYEASRGCPFGCSYCLSACERKVRLRSTDKVKKELQFFLEKKAPQVKFIDRTFNCSRTHAMEIWQYIKEHDNGVTNFHFEIAADIMDEGELALLKSLRPGLVQLEIGVQSTNGQTLKEINRSTDIRKIASVTKALRQGKNIHIHLDLIAGLPFEGYESFIRSFDEVYAMKPQQLQLGFLKVLKGTPLWEKADMYGIVCQDKPPYEALYTKWISYGEILKLKQVEEMVELYYNSNQFVSTLPVLEKLFAGPFAMFEKLADFYEGKGYFTNAPARGYRYQILLEFAISRAPEAEELYRELLTYDYYLRENAKSRPVFSRELSAWREDIWRFYQKEEREPEFLKAYGNYHARQTMKMTHMDVFFYPVWEEEKSGGWVRREKPGYVLFDYGERDAITGQAATLVVMKEDK